MKKENRLYDTSHISIDPIKYVAPKLGDNELSELATLNQMGYYSPKEIVKDYNFNNE